VGGEVRARRHAVLRGATATLLIVAFYFPMVAPLFTSGPDAAELPPCCRRNGKHHCMMYMMLTHPLQYRYVTEKCPYSPFAGVALMLPHVFQNRSEPEMGSQSSGFSFTVRQAAAGFRVSVDRTRYKRGPPELLHM
jgi:hypothetical protein